MSDFPTPEERERLAELERQAMPSERVRAGDAKEEAALLRTTLQYYSAEKLAEIAALRGQVERLKAVLGRYVEEYGGIHDDADCPEDDNCECVFAQETNAALSAAPAPAAPGPAHPKRVYVAGPISIGEKTRREERERLRSLIDAVIDAADTARAWDREMSAAQAETIKLIRRGLSATFADPAAEED